MKIVILGLSITSSWGNGHATTYRALIRNLTKRGHEILFLEYDKPWYATARDLNDWPYGKIALYQNFEELREKFTHEIKYADAVILGSYVPEGVSIGRWMLDTAKGVKVFYDIDTPISLSKLERGDFEYLHPSLIPEYDLYLSFTSGPLLKRIETKYRASKVKPLYCSVDTDSYYPQTSEQKWELGYLGTYSSDREEILNRLFFDVAKELPAHQFVLAGSQYPETFEWPKNIERFHHLPPPDHRAFYNSQHFTLNITRKDMITAGYSPSVRLFEAAACGMPIISDYWKGLESIFKLDEEIFIADSTQDVIRILKETSEEKRLQVSERARTRVLQDHSSQVRAAELETYLLEVLDEKYVSHLPRNKRTLNA
jgi:spore maturation protein CgeB